MRACNSNKQLLQYFIRHFLHIKENQLLENTQHVYFSIYGWNFLIPLLLRYASYKANWTYTKFANFFCY